MDKRRPTPTAEFVRDLLLAWRDRPLADDQRTDLEEEVARLRHENHRMRDMLYPLRKHLRPSERALLEGTPEWRASSVRPLPPFGHYLTHPCPKCGEVAPGPARHCADGMYLGDDDGEYPCPVAVNADATQMAPYHVHRRCRGQNGECLYTLDEAAERCDHARTEQSRTYPDGRLCLLCGVTVRAT